MATSMTKIQISQRTQPKNCPKNITSNQQRFVIPFTIEVRRKLFYSDRRASKSKVTSQNIQQTLFRGLFGGGFSRSEVWFQEENRGNLKIMFWKRTLENETILCQNFFHTCWLHHPQRALNAQKQQTICLCKQTPSIEKFGNFKFHSHKKSLMLK